jgi:predicted nucleic acid-binding protein
MGLQANGPMRAHPAQTVVLDTNTVLAWLWFSDLAVAGLAAAVEQGQLTWRATVAMRAELASVLPRLPPRAAAPDAAGVLEAFDSLSRPALPAPTAHRLLCTDAADQPFIDLAIAAQARWLFSRDRAVLKLRRRAATLGLRICPPDGWQFVP